MLFRSNDKCHTQLTSTSSARMHTVGVPVKLASIVQQEDRESCAKPHVNARRLLDKSQLVRRKALQAMDALSKHAPQSSGSLHALSAAKKLLDAAMPHLLALVSAPPDSPLAADGASQVTHTK